MKNSHAHSLLAVAALLALTACPRSAPPPVLKNLRQEFIIVVPQTTAVSESKSAPAQPAATATPP